MAAQISASFISSCATMAENGKACDIRLLHQFTATLSTNVDTLRCGNLEQSLPEQCSMMLAVPDSCLNTYRFSATFRKELLTDYRIAPSLGKNTSRIPGENNESRTRPRRRLPFSTRGEMPVHGIPCVSVHAEPAALLLEEVRACAHGPAAGRCEQGGHPRARQRRQLAERDELHELAMRAAADLIAEEPSYSHVACRLLSRSIEREVDGSGRAQFPALGGTRVRAGPGEPAPARFREEPCDRRWRPRSIRAAATASNTSACARSTNATCCAIAKAIPVFETPQYCWMRIAASLSHTADDAKELYRLLFPARLPAQRRDAACTRARRRSTCRAAT